MPSCFRRSLILLTTIIMLTSCGAITAASPAKQINTSSVATKISHTALHSSTTTFKAQNRASSTTTGTARVAYAGSLVEANEQVIGPAFEKATGDHYLAVKAGGSFGVAKLIAAHQVQANVFESVGSAPITSSLVPHFTSWYVPFAASPLVIAYSSKSRFAPTLTAIAHGKQPIQNLFKLLEQPGFRLGRTNPATDPQGQAFVFMLELAAQQYHMPDLVQKALGSPTANSKQIFAETALLAYLQSGQIDASSAFLSQAIQQHLNYIPLPPQINMGDPAFAATYANVSLTLPNGSTIHGAPLVLYITTIKGSPDQSAGIAFVHFVLSPQGKALYQREGYQPVPSAIEGNAQDAPASIRAETRQ